MTTRTTVLDSIGIVRAALLKFGYTVADMIRKSVDIDALADHIGAGLNVDAFLTALDRGLDVETFNYRQAGSDCTDFNNALSQLNERVQQRCGPVNRAIAACTRGETPGCRRVRSMRYHAIRRVLRCHGE